MPRRKEYDTMVRIRITDQMSARISAQVAKRGPPNTYVSVIRLAIDHWLDHQEGKDTPSGLDAPEGKDTNTLPRSW